MHSTLLSGNDMVRVIMHHNSDFSGDVEIVEKAPSGAVCNRWTIPGLVIRMIRENAWDDMVDWLQACPYKVKI